MNIRILRLSRFFSRFSLAFAIAIYASTGAFVAALVLDFSPVYGVAPGDTRDGDSGTSGPQAFGHLPVAVLGASYEVTNFQYCAFLNAVDPDATNTLGLYNGTMATHPHGGILVNTGNAPGTRYAVRPGYTVHPVVFVSFYDAARFANWLHNDQPSGGGGTESGAYTLDGGTPVPSNGAAVTRAAGARYWIPSENEWYRAKYGEHRPGPASDGQPRVAWRSYASGAAPLSAFPGADNGANYFRNDGSANGYNDGYAVTGSTSFNPAQNYLTEAGSYPSASYFGLRDLDGNVGEWNEQPFDSGSKRGVRGGSWSDSLTVLQYNSRSSALATAETESLGFRVFAAAPQPPVLTGVAVRRSHGPSGNLSVTLPLSGPPYGLETRWNGGSSDTFHLEFTFDKPVVSGAAADDLDTPLQIQQIAAVTGNKIVVSLSGSGIAGWAWLAISTVIAGDGSVAYAASSLLYPLGLLPGDVNASSSVNSTDVLGVRLRLGQAASPTNLRSDVNADGTINAVDQELVRGRSGSGLGVPRPQVWERGGVTPFRPSER